MAIPFFEPRPSDTIIDAQQFDQVDGYHGGSTAPSTTTPTSTTPTTIATNLNSAAVTTTEATTEQPPATNDATSVLSWKILALAVCKALKEYHQQSSSAQEAFSGANGSVVLVLPNGEVQPIWK